MGTKTCISCGKARNTNKFSQNFKLKNGKPGFRNVCRDCDSLRKKKFISSTPYTYLTKVHTQSKSKRSKDMEWLITAEDLHDLWDEQGGRCALSGIFMTYGKDGNGVKEFNASIDRIDSSKPVYSRTNVQLVTYRVNIMKHTLTEDLLLWWCRNLIAKHDKID